MASGLSDSMPSTPRLCHRNLVDCCGVKVEADLAVIVSGDGIGFGLTFICREGVDMSVSTSLPRAFFVILALLSDAWMMFWLNAVPFVQARL